MSKDKKDRDTFTAIRHKRVGVIVDMVRIAFAAIPAIAERQPADGISVAASVKQVMKVSGLP